MKEGSVAVWMKDALGAVEYGSVVEDDSECLEWTYQMTYIWRGWMFNIRMIRCICLGYCLLQTLPGRIRR